MVAAVSHCPRQDTVDELARLGMPALERSQQRQVDLGARSVRICRRVPFNEGRRLAQPPRQQEVPPVRPGVQETLLKCECLFGQVDQAGTCSRGSPAPADSSDPAASTADRFAGRGRAAPDARYIDVSSGSASDGSSCSARRYSGMALRVASPRTSSRERIPWLDESGPDRARAPRPAASAVLRVR